MAGSYYGGSTIINTWRPKRDPDIVSSYTERLSDDEKKKKKKKKKAKRKGNKKKKDEYLYSLAKAMVNGDKLPSPPVFLKGKVGADLKAWAMKQSQFHKKYQKIKEKRRGKRGNKQSGFDSRAVPVLPGKEPISERVLGLKQIARWGRCSYPLDLATSMSHLNSLFQNKSCCLTLEQVFSCDMVESVLKNSGRKGVLVELKSVGKANKAILLLEKIVKRIGRVSNKRKATEITVAIWRSFEKMQ